MRSSVQAWKLRTLRDYYTRYSVPNGRSWAKAHLRGSTTSLKHLWNNGAKDPDTFYTEDDVGAAYIGDLTAWHSSGTINAWFSAVVDAASGTTRSILDYGAGIGTYSLMLAEQGHCVDACEANSTLREYIDWRSTRHNINVNTTPEPLNTTYDMIVCIDTLEHLSSPEDTLKQFYTLLRPTGMLCATWTFHQSNGEHPMHHDETRLSAFLTTLNEYFYGPIANTWPATYLPRS